MIGFIALIGWLLLVSLVIVVVSYLSNLHPFGSGKEPDWRFVGLLITAIWIIAFLIYLR